MDYKTNTRRMVVSMPHEIAQPVRWADRHASKRNANGARHTKSRTVKRTLAQTGAPASEGRIGYVRPMPRQAYATHIPARSGRRSAQSRGIVRRMLLVAALLAIGIVGVGFALSSTNFQIHQIDITGTQNTRIIDDIQHLGIQGQNIFLLDAGGLTTQIESLPMVGSVTLSKQLPNLVIINVVERTPVLLWQTQKGTFSVDTKGMVIAPASDTSGADRLLTVVDLSKAGAQQVHPGAMLNAADIAFVTQLNADLKHLPGMPAFTLRYDALPGQGRHGSFIVASSNGWLAYLGSADESNPLDNRLIELQQILHLAELQQLTLATIDLRFGLRPVYTLKS